MEFVKKVWILDTDIGWDPDDIIALLCLIQYIKKSDDKLAIISSNETINNNRAFLIRNIVDELIPDNNIHVFSGINNKETNNVPLFASFLLYHINNNKNILNIDKIIDYINESIKNNYYITWLGIGSMTNLAYLLKKNIKPHYVIQMGGTIFDEVEFNINLDIDSCKYVLENWNNRDTLEFITLDTTGYNLEWIKSAEEEKLHNRLSENFKNILSNKYPYIYETIINNIKSNKYFFGYHGSSSLHDPLTIMYALDNSILKTYNSRIFCNIDGKWNVKIERKSISKLNIGNKYFEIWYNDIKNNINIVNNIERYNCKISIGPLNDNEINNFINKLFILLIKD